MAYNPSPRNLLRSRILRLPLFGEQRLSRTIRVINNSMLGHGDICEVYRHGKNGAAKCADEFGNVYCLSELSQAVCAEILAALPAD